MSLDSFLYDLQFDTDKTKPPDLQVDWEDAPLKYKLYRGLPVVPLPPEVPLTLAGRNTPAKPDLCEIGHFLWYAFGLNQFAQFGPMQLFRRFAPSGGGLYPNEVYIYLKIAEVRDGIYHYDAAHHRLVLLREGNFDDYVAAAAGNRCDVTACFATVFVSTAFWKNFYKYDNFAYRLQGLDAGVLIGQLLEVAKRFRFDAGVMFQFLDRAVNHLLGLSEREESVYALIPLSTEPAAQWFAVREEGGKFVTATELCRHLPAVRHDTYNRSRRVKEYPLLLRMNEACFRESSRSFRRLEGERSGRLGDEGETVALPRAVRLSYDLASICRKRFSPEADFVLAGQVNKPQLASLLQETTRSFAYRNDLDGGRDDAAPRVSMHVCLYRVEGVPDGAYRYDPSALALRRMRHGDQRFRLQCAMTLDNVNLFQVPLCFHVTGSRNRLDASLGYRGYRIQQMEAGMLVQRLLLAAFAAGMGGRPLLGFDASSCDELYRLAPEGETCLIQIPVGPYRHRPRLEGSLHG